ncbi:MAG: HEAT repeat domain-containing protein [Candidatus Melainabacteria bacterium]|nr:HEAT repeat domain-containing protein [Candidatus Melainabacteria bacterium]
MSTIRIIASAFVNAGLFLAQSELKATQSAQNATKPVPAQAAKLDTGFNKEKVKKMIGDLDSGLFATREKATSELVIGLALSNDLFPYVLDEYPKASLEVQRRLDRMIKKIIGQRGIYLASDEKTNLNTFKYLAEHGGYPIKIRLLFNKGFTDENSMSLILNELPDDVLGHLVSVTNRALVLDVLRKNEIEKKIHFENYLAKNPSITEETMEKFANSENVVVRFSVAANRSLTKELLEKLAQDKDSNVRAAVAANRSTKKELLEKLLQDECPEVVQAAAANKNLPKELLEQLAESKRLYIRLGIAANKNTRKEILEKLIQDECSEVIQAVLANENLSKELLEQLAKSERLYIRLGVAANKNTRKEILEKLLQDKCPEIRQEAAGNESLPKELLEQLAESTDRYIKAGIAQNKNTSKIKGLLEKLARDVAPFVRYHVIYNNNVTLELLIELGTYDNNNHNRNVARFMLNKCWSNYLTGLIDSSLNQERFLRFLPFHLF